MFRDLWVLTAYRDFPLIKMSKKEVKLIHYLSNRAKEHFSLLAMRGDVMSCSPQSLWEGYPTVRSGHKTEFLILLQTFPAFLNTPLGELRQSELRRAGWQSEPPLVCWAVVLSLGRSLRCAEPSMAWPPPRQGWAAQDLGKSGFSKSKVLHCFVCPVQIHHACTYWCGLDWFWAWAASVHVCP